MKYVVIGVFVAGLALVGWRLLAPAADGALDELTLPELSASAAAGQRLFAANCAAFHGQNGVGTEQGPPLIHVIYNPGHHSDAAFCQAVTQGVGQHHWPFGDMPAQPQLATDDIASIIGFGREVQKANGIVYQPYQM